MRKVVHRIKVPEIMELIKQGAHLDINKYPDINKSYRVHLTLEEWNKILKYRETLLKESQPINNLKKTVLTSKKEILTLQNQVNEYKQILKIKDALGDIELYELSGSEEATSGKDTVAIALLSDVHVTETVLPESVMYLNEYNLDVAKKRLDKFFLNLVKLINHHQKNYRINRLILGFLGDFISGWIHEELQQTNEGSPIDSLQFTQNILFSGLKYLNDNLNVDNIDVICICGNHGRTTNKVQYSNYTAVSYETILYTSLSQMCESTKLNKINFIIPKSAMAIIEIFGKKYMFAHGMQFKYNSGIGGIYIPMLKWALRMISQFGLTKIFIGHWHTLLNIPEIAVNGSVIGYNARSMNFGLTYEPPQQSLILINEKRGFVNHQPIYLE